jgi:aspartate racemase
LISIVEATCNHAKDHGYRRLGLFGTRFTMQASFFFQAFEKAGMSLVVPSSDDQDYIHEKYLDELVKGIFLPQTRGRILAIAEKLKIHDHIEALILGGTELPLLLTEDVAAPVPLLDTMRIHAKAVLTRWLEMQ